MTLEKTVSALKSNGIEVIVVNTVKEAKDKVLELIPQGSEVFDATSKTLEDVGLKDEMQEGSRYVSIRKKIQSINNETERAAARRQSVSPDYIVGSVQAVTESGQLVMASNTGSQLAPYVYGAAHVIWVVGTQKIVKNLDQAFERIKERALPYEDERVQKLYGIRSAISKMVIIQKERPNRVVLIFVKQNIGI